jgi:hypothetical protein
VNNFGEAQLVESINRIKADTTLHPTFSWVAATGKTELFVRDHLGADLSIRNPDLIISREWNKHDLVILDKEVNPLVVIEGKALYDFDLLDPSIRAVYQKALAKDRVKLIDRDAPESFMTLLMTSVLNPIPESLRRVTKYSPGINKGLKKYGVELMPSAVAEARRFLNEFGNVVYETKLVSGVAVDCEINIWIWLIEIKD